MKIRNYLIPVFSVLALASCNYEQINTNIYGVTEEGMKTGGLLYGAPFMDMQKLVIPIGSPTESTGPGNDLANTDIMSAGNYIGYWGMNNNWNFNTEATWNFTDARMSYAYQNFYSKLFRAWNDIYKHTKDSEDPADKEVRAVANIVKAVAWLRATDVFGPIVYNQRRQRRYCTETGFAGGRVQSDAGRPEGRFGTAGKYRFEGASVVRCDL